MSPLSSLLESLLTRFKRSKEVLKRQSNSVNLFLGSLRYTKTIVQNHNKGKDNEMEENITTMSLI